MPAAAVRLGQSGVDLIKVLPRSGGTQELRHRTLTPLQRMLQRRYTLCVGQVQLGSARDQHSHNLGMRRPTVAQNHRLQQCGPAEPVDMVHIDGGGQQQANGVHMASLAGWDQGRTSIPVGASDVSADRQCGAHDLGETTGAGQ